MEFNGDNSNEKKGNVILAWSQILGTRPSQQDSYLVRVNGPYSLGCVCDGMGGLRGGEQASQKAVEILAYDFKQYDGRMPASEFLKREAARMNDAVFDLEDDLGNPLDGGSTVVAAMICENLLYIMSSGDSRIYMIQGNQIRALTRDHNYLLSLEIMKKRNKITEEEFNIEARSKGAALISYLGMENQGLVDVNQEPIRLEKGDTIMLASDGLYRTLGEAGIVEILTEHRNLQDAADVMTEKVEARKKKHQDNSTVVLMRYC